MNNKRTQNAQVKNKPNIIYILADDMGYGDMGCNNPESRIPTPNLDALADRGVRFADAHAGSSVCTPSRYNILTGRYAWRSRLKRGIVWEWDSPLIEEGRLTVAGLLRQQGYATHCLGKWHLGWAWKTQEGTIAGDELPFGQFNELTRAQRIAMGGRIDYGAPIGGGPVHCGFDSYFGVDVPNFTPYTWFENDHVTEAPSMPKPAEMYGQPGDMVPGWSLEAMIPEFTRRAVRLIEDADRPFFLHFPLTAPHAPICPNKAFIGRSRAGKYGDFVCEVDWVVGQVVEALRRTGQLENTLLVFASDNGPESLPADHEGAYALAHATGHYSMGGLRGVKRDTWEGGHRVPFVVSWPAGFAGGRVCGHPVCLGDWMATCADVLGVALPTDAGEDSVSLLPVLRGQDGPRRDHVIHHSASGVFAVRKGDWVYIDGCGGDMVPEPDWWKAERGYAVDDCPGQLFNLREDLVERRNRYRDDPGKVEELRAIIESEKAGEKLPAPGREPDHALTE